MAIASGQVTLNSSTPTKICTMGEGGALVIAGTASVVFVGGPNVTTANGIPVSNTTPMQVPGARTVSSMTVPAGTDNTCDLYGIATTGSPTVNFLAPQGG